MRFRPMVIVALMGASAPAAAHHSFAAEFDEKNCAEFTGPLLGVDWQNPHAYFFIDSKNHKGVAGKLTFQTSSLANMIRGGTPRGYFVMNMGKTVTVRGCASLNGTDNRYAASWVRVGDGALHRVGQDVERIFGSNN